MAFMLEVLGSQHSEVLCFKAVSAWASAAALTTASLLRSRQERVSVAISMVMYTANDVQFTPGECIKNGRRPDVQHPSLSVVINYYLLQTVDTLAVARTVPLATV